MNDQQADESPQRSNYIIDDDPRHSLPGNEKRKTKFTPVSGNDIDKWPEPQEQVDHNQIGLTLSEMSQTMVVENVRAFQEVRMCSKCGSKPALP